MTIRFGDQAVVIDGCLIAFVLSILGWAAVLLGLAAILVAVAG